MTPKSSILNRIFLCKPSIWFHFGISTVLGNPHEKRNSRNCRNPSLLGLRLLTAGVLFIRIFSSTSQFSSVAPVGFGGAASSAAISGAAGMEWTCRHGNSYFIQYLYLIKMIQGQGRGFMMPLYGYLFLRKYEQCCSF